MFTPALRLASRSATSSVLRAQAPRRGLASLTETLYTAKAVASGAGRNGKAECEENGLKLDLAMPKSLGGPGNGANPEQLFAMGYASCFLSALQLVSREAKAKLPEDLKVDASVHLGKPDNGKPFGLAVDLAVSSPSGKAPDNIKELVEKAHEVCPYSNATRGQIAVNLKM